MYSRRPRAGALTSHSTRKALSNAAGLPQGKDWRAILENYYVVLVFHHAFMNGIGPQIKAAKWQDVFSSYKRTGYAYPWEDIELKS
jgi:hypothetical protein